MDGTNNPTTDDIARAVERALANHPGLQALNEMLVEADAVARAKGLHRNTISQNESVEKYQETGKRKLLMRVRDVPVLRNRKRGKK
jgi:hypothetical protein